MGDVEVMTVSTETPWRTVILGARSMLVGHNLGDNQCYFYVTPLPRERTYSHDMIYSECHLVVDCSKRTEVDKC